MSRQREIDASMDTIDKVAREHLSALVKTWEEIGLDDESVKLRFTQCQSHVDALFREMKKEDQDLKERLTAKVSTLLNQLDEFNRDLDKNESVDVHGLALIAAKNKLELSLRDLKVLHAQRKEERALLEKEESELCKVMGRQPEEPPAEKCLSDPAMKELRDHLIGLRQDRHKLLSEFLKIRNHIIDLYSDLEEQPSTEFHLKITDPNTHKFPLDPISLVKVAELDDALTSRVQQIEEEAAQLRLQLANLWDRLDVDPMTRTMFLENHPGFSKSTREELREEVARCEELKMQNLEKFTLRMRDELMEYWDKCLVSDEERDAFHPFTSMLFTEELLEVHEAEVKRYETFFSENKEIFDLLSRRAELWERMTQLEVAATDSNRLNNRGGQLLKEEKERKQIQKELPKVEDKIKKLIHSREETNGEPFLLNGRRASLVLSEQWDAKRLQKEAEKQNKKMAQQKQLERDAIMGTTMLAGQKRKMVPGTPDLTRKVARITPAPARAATTAGKTGKFARPVTRPTQKRLNMAPPSKEPNKLINDSIASTMSYTDFTKHLETRATRSSAVSASARVQIRAPCSPINSTMSSSGTPARQYQKTYQPKSCPAKPPRSLRPPQTPTGRTVVTTTLSAARSASRPTRKVKDLPIIF